MTHGKYSFGYRLRALSNRALICACLIACLIAGGCRSSRNTVEETHRETHATVKETFETDTLNAAATSRETQSDTDTVRADERTTISIKRDTAGRIIEINSRRSSEIIANGVKNTESDSRFHGIETARSSEATDSVDSVTQKKEETAKAVNVGIPLENIIGTALLGLALLYVIYVIFVDHILPCIRKRRK